MSGSANTPSTPPGPAPATDALRCPRCGGACAPRARRPDARNPFLASKKPSHEVTCQDCGLDFESRPDSRPDSGRDSGRSPWSSK
jgi:hypothetical protein